MAMPQSWLLKGIVDVHVTGKDKVESLDKRLQGLRRTFLRLTGIGSSLLFLRDIVRTTTAVTDEVARIAEGLSISYKQASQLSYAIRKVGLDIPNFMQSMIQFQDTIFKSLEQMQKASRTTLTPFEKIGVELVNTRGEIRNTMEILYDVADRFKALREQGYSLGYLKQVFGVWAIFGADRFLRVLNSGSAGLKELMGQAEQVGWVWDELTAKMGIDFIKTMIDLNLAWTAFKFNLGITLMPVLRSVANALASLSRNVLTELRTILAEISLPLRIIGNILGNLALIVGKLALALVRGIAGFNNLGKSGKSLSNSFSPLLNTLKSLSEWITNVKKNSAGLEAFFESFGAGMNRAFRVLGIIVATTLDATSNLAGALWDIIKAGHAFATGDTAKGMEYLQRASQRGGKALDALKEGYGELKQEARSWREEQQKMAEGAGERGVSPGVSRAGGIIGTLLGARLGWGLLRGGWRTVTGLPRTLWEGGRRFLDWLLMRKPPGPGAPGMPGGGGVPPAPGGPVQVPRSWMDIGPAVERARQRLAPVVGPITGWARGTVVPRLTPILQRLQPILRRAGPIFRRMFGRRPRLPGMFSLISWASLMKQIREAPAEEKLGIWGGGAGGIAGGWAGALAGEKLGAGIGSIFGPLGTVMGGGVGALASGLLGAFGGEKLGAKIAEVLQGAVKMASEDLKQLGGQIAKEISEGWSTASAWASGKWNAIKDAFTGWLSEQKENLLQMGRILAHDVSEGWNTITAWVGQKWDAIKTSFTNWLNEQAENLRQFGQIVAHDVSEGWNIAKAWVGGKWDAITTSLSAWIESSVEALGNFGSQIAAHISNVWASAETWAAERWEGLKLSLSAWIKAGENWFTEHGQKIAGAISGVWANVSTWADERWEGIKKSAYSWYEASNAWLTEHGKAIAETISGAWSEVKTWAVERWEGIKQSLIDWFGPSVAWFAERGRAIANAISDVWASAKTWAKEKWNAIKESFDAWWNDIKAWFADIGRRIGAWISSHIKIKLPSISGLLSSPNYQPGYELPRAQHGAVVTGPTALIAGEGREPEAILPLSKLRGLLGNVRGGGDTYIYITGNVARERDLANMVADVLMNRYGVRARIVLG